jgi:hypothetical protein
MSWAHGTKLVLVAAVLAAALPTLAAASSWHDGWHGWGRWRQARQADWCARKAEYRLGERMEIVEMSLALRPEQREAWSRLAAAVEASGRELKVLCGAVAFGTPEAMARLEAGIETSLAAVRALRPPLEALYGQLDPGQRSRLDGLLRGRL